jgi:hypothetical protein
LSQPRADGAHGPPASNAEPSGVGRELNIGGGPPIDDSRRLDLRDVGFTYRVSDEARAEIAANERRAMRVLATAHKYWFGGHG